MISNSLIKECWQRSFRLFELDTTVQPSIPILWFGNEEKYERSERRILTVALNPSRREFQENAHQSPSAGLRFPAAAHLQGKPELSDEDVEAHRSAMNEYFERNPYEKWFKWFERPLNEIGASYYRTNKKPYRTIHIDIHSPVATDPTWGKLQKCGKDYRYVDVDNLFDSLLDELKPDVILVSVDAQEVYNTFGVDIPYPRNQGYIHAFDLRDRGAVS